MEEQKQEQPGLTDQLKEYIETRIKLARYQAIDKGTSFVANLVTEIFVLICIGMTFFFATITLALFLGHVLNSYWMGFGCVAILYFVLAMIVKAISNQYIEPRIINFLIKKIFKPKK
ncbi:MAG: phage holin family protein [Mucilaginibacter sp.]|uniref:phage holin family protein n=1 Tax=Mucilaginibacter sp. TaxID=1882438 RepID=UPI003263B74E